jgi:hypothetical protein
MTHSSVACALAALAVCAASAPALAQTTPFVVERPSFSTPPQVVGAGFWQIEAGLGWDHDAPEDGDGTTIFSAPNATLRLGMTRRLELRAATSGVVSVRDESRRQTSAADTALGVKYQVAFQEGFGLDIALIPMISLPTGGAASTGNADPSAVLSAQRGFGRSALLLNARWSAPATGAAATERARSLQYSAAFSFPVIGRWSAFTEGVVTDARVADTAMQVNGGLSRVFGTNLEVDVYGGVGANDAAPAWRVGAGVAWRVRR